MVFDNAANVRIKVVLPIVEQQWFTVFGREYDVQQNSVVGRHGLAPVVASRLFGLAGHKSWDLRPRLSHVVASQLNGFGSQ